MDTEEIAARLSAVEFAAALGLLSYAHYFWASAWNEETLAERLEAMAAANGIPFPTGAAREALLRIIRTTATMRKLA